MNNENLYEATVHRLCQLDYRVSPDEHGYIIQHQTDNDDVSRARHLGDLVDFADLVDWRDQQQVCQRVNQPR